jgi:putative acetyltransferase
MSAIEIREEQPDDIRSVRELNQLAFGQPDEGVIVDKLRQNCGDLLSLVALIRDKVVGHILFSPVTIEGENRTVQGMGLGPMAVTPELQRRGIGSALIRTGMTEMKKRGSPFVLLIGHPEYYPRFGFRPASRHGIRSEWEVPDEAFLINVIDESEMQGFSGLAKYRPEFAE